MNLIIVPITTTEQIDLAINLGMGIKTNDRQQQTLLLHTIPIDKDKEPLIKRFFDFTLYQRKEMLLPQLKLTVFNHLIHFGWKAAILLDINTMIVPGKKMADLFSILEPHDFTAYTNDLYNFKTQKRTRHDYTFNCDANEAKLHFGLSNDFPQIKTSFIYFKNCDRARFLFDTAQHVYDSYFWTAYKTHKSAEACLNIACSFTGIYPHQTPYMPVFWQTLTAVKNDEYIYHQYPLFEVDLINPQSDRVVALYNRVTDYYRLANGIQEQHHYRGLVPVKEARKVFGFYHICAVNHFKEIVKEQVASIVSSGLYDKADAIFCAVVGDKKDTTEAQGLLKDYPKFKVLSCKEDLKLYEFPTLRLIKSKSEQEKPFFGFYIHTKGVSFPKAPHKAGGDHWRGYLMKYNIEFWKQNIENLKKGNHLSGATWIPEGDFKQHYRGNFFWFNSEYTKKLPAIDDLNTVDRFQAEFWIGHGNPMIASLADLPIDYANRLPY